MIPFIEIIEATTPDPNLLMWKFNDDDKEIKNGAKLVVRESQHVLFLNEGQLADIFKPGTHTLTTENIPVLSHVKGWKYGFESPFKADIYFFNTHQFINNKWGTPAPILLRDPQFGQIRVRAFGSYDIKIADIGIFFRQYAGTYQQLTISELQNQLRDFVTPKFGEVLAEQNITVMDIAGNISALSKKIEPMLRPYFSQFGLDLTQFIITSVTLPNEVTAHYDKITNMNMVQDLDKYAKFNTANAIDQKGTAINEGIHNAMMVNMLLHNMNQTKQTQKSEDDITTKLQKLKGLFDGGLIDEAEYKQKKQELLGQL